jgi:nitrite reductase/ring-hydroxylating ferredoxin subunit
MCNDEWKVTSMNNRVDFYTAPQRTFPFPTTPNGWYRMVYSDELAPGQLTTVRYFDRDLVVYRGEDGVARTVDAYCRHLGAHLGFGGKVQGGDIVCPFHGWSWNGATGRCTHIPYSKTPPSAVLQPHWQTIERNGYVAIWYHRGGAEPDYEIPVIKETSDPDYFLLARRRMVVNSHLQEIYENVVDFAHLSHLHKMDIQKVNWEPLGDPNSPVVRLTIDMKRDSAQSAEGGETTIEAFMYGPGLQATYLRGRITGITVNGLTPIEGNKVEISHSYYVHRHCDATQQEVEAFFEYYYQDHALDVNIWDHKVHLENPALVKNDGDIHRFRKWFTQFYAAAPVAANVVRMQGS